MKKLSLTILALVFGLVTFLPEVASSETLKLKVTAGAPNLVTFTSVAPLETIVGKTNAISGTVSFDPADLSASTAVLEVQMATLDTDNRVRDGHMRDNHLHTDRYPISRFTLDGINGNPGALSNGKPARFKARGTFLCHGVTKNIEPEVTAIWDASTKTLAVEATFSVSLPDYQIPRPQFLVMKLEEQQAISVKFVAR